MARIRSAWRGDTLQVTAVGRLTAADMGRLEHACGPALVMHPIQLELDLRRVEDVDRIAHAIVEHLAARGARVVRRVPQAFNLRLVPPCRPAATVMDRRSSARRGGRRRDG